MTFSKLLNKDWFDLTFYVATGKFNFNGHLDFVKLLREIAEKSKNVEIEAVEKFIESLLLKLNYNPDEQVTMNDDKLKQASE